MSKSRFTDEQIVAIIRETGRDTVPEVAKRASIYTWKNGCGAAPGCNCPANDRGIKTYESGFLSQAQPGDIDRSNALALFPKYG